MKSYSGLIFSLLLITTVVFVSSIGNSFADDVSATSKGFEDSTILELKNSRVSTQNIDSVRIWLDADNEFKSFKTEKGWIGKNTPQGVIIFTSEKDVNPGDGVKFGIKTTKQNPTIIWKALDVNGEIISSAKTTTSRSNENNVELNESKIVAIKDESSFRFIPEKPTSNSDFRVIGENFVPNQFVDFYIGDKLEKTVRIDENGKILFTAKIPLITNDERTEFILSDSEQNEKTISIRIPQTENRDIPDIIKLSLGNTPQEAKRGGIVVLEGMATPNITLTVTSKNSNGDIIKINTIQTGFDGRWTFDNLIDPTVELGTLSIEISDGKSIALRNIDVISAKVINLVTTETKYESGEIVIVEGVALPNTEMSIIVEDSIGGEFFSRTVNVGETGEVNFNVEIPRGSIEGTYIILAYQGNEEGVSIFGVGQEPEPILIVRPTKMNFATEEQIEISIQGPPNAQISLILIDAADREKISDSINLGPDGREIYNVPTEIVSPGAYTLSAKRGESSGSATFTIGLTTGSGDISIMTTKSEYVKGEQMLILGNTESINVLLDITILDPNGKIIKKIETFSDKFAVFKIDNFRVPLDAVEGEWSIMGKSGGNFKESKFVVIGDVDTFTIKTDKNSYNTQDLMIISGKGAKRSATVRIKIF